MDIGRLEAYADLIVSRGLNLNHGQEVLLIAGLDQPEFVRMTAEKCYLAGASRVVVEWTDMPLGKLAQRYQKEETLSEVTPWELARLKWQMDDLPALLWLDSDDPDGMDGIDQGKRARAQMARFPVIKPFRDAMENKHQWCIAGVPGAAWARKVFPGVSDAEATEKLWEAILHVSRADGDPLANWDEHNASLRRRSDKLNEHRFRELRYRAPNGTDFRVGLMPEGVFSGGSETDLSGREFNPNIPSEEIFTTPKRGEAEGVLAATKPLSWQGSMIEDFTVRFAGGRAVEVRAKRGQEALEKLIAMDEGSPYLGECALIAHDSPVGNTGLLFYNTLYDENASCHVALGRGFDNCVRDYAKYSQKELRKLGVNDSMIHVDFMIGGAELDIDGVTASGETIPIFRKGAWCF